MTSKPQHISNGYISSIEASRYFGITNDYVSFLCRRGNVRAEQCARLWYVDKKSLETYLERMRLRKEESRKKLSAQLQGEYREKAGARHFLRLLFVGLIFFLIFIPTPTVQAAQTPPQILNYQGRLSDSSGVVLGGTSGATYYFKFSIWDSASGGTLMWPSTAHSVSATVRQGVFSVSIGDTANGYPDALTLDFSRTNTLYLQVEVSSNNSVFETLSPRQQISAVAFAQLAGAVVGTTTPSLFGTTTAATNSFVTIAATNTNSTALSVVGFAGQVADLFNITNAGGSSLFSVDASGGLHGAGLTNCDPSTQKLVWSNGQFACATDQNNGGGGGAFPFNADTNFGQLVYSTTTPTLWFKSGIFASSTSIFANASSTLFTASSAWITKFANLPTAGFVKTASDGTLSVDTTSYATSASLNTYLPLSDWYSTTSVASITTLPNLLVNSSQVSNLPAYTFPSNATSTQITFNGGLLSVGSTTISGNGTTTGNFSVGSLTLNGTRFTDTNISQWLNDAGYLTSLSGAASSTLLADTNTFSGSNTFATTITGSVSGNAGTVTNGVYTTTFNGLFDARFITNLAGTTSVASIVSLPNLLVTSLQVSDFGSAGHGLFSAGSGINYNSSTGVIANTIGYPFINNATTTLIAFNGGASTTLLSVANGLSTTTINGAATSTFGADIISKSVVPSADATYDLGSPTNRFRDLYLSTASLHLDSTASETGSAKSWKFGIDTGDGLTTGTSTGFFRIQEGNSPMFYLNHAGQVGIGLQNPSARLEIQGNPFLTGPSSGTLSSSGASVTGSGTSFMFGYNKINVGDQILANGQIRTVTAILSNTSVTVDSAFTPALSNEIFQTQQPIAKFDSSAGTNKVVIGPGGNVGINDINPNSLLTVGANDAFQVNNFGTVASGTWNGSLISPQFGGTGSTTLTGILVGNGTSGVQTLNVGIGLTLSGATLSAAASFGYPFQGNSTSTLINFVGGLSSASTTLTGNFVFGNATGTNATTTSLAILNLNSGSCDVKANTSGLLFCGTDQTSTGAANDFIFANNYGVLSAATSSAIWAQSGLFASSTSYFANASSTLFTAPTAWISKLANLASAGFVKTASDGTLSVDITSYTPTIRAINTAYPLQGGGDLSADRTFTLAFGTTTSNTWANTQTFTNAPILGTLSGLVGSNNGALYQIATSSSFVTSLAAGAGIALSGATGAVTITNTSAAPFPLNATSSLLTFSTGLSSASTTLTGPFVFGNATGTNATTTNFYTSGTATIGSFSGLLKAVGGVVTTALSGTDYATPAQINGAFPFTIGVGYNSTSTVVGFNGLFSTASSTFNNNVFFPNLSAGVAYIGSSGLHSTTATGTVSGSGPISVTAGQSVIGSGLTISCASCSTFAYPFAGSGNSTSSPVMLLASTTVGAGGATTGLTINGGATTTGNHFVGGTLTINTLSGLIGGNNGVTYGISTSSLNANITGSAGSVANAVTFNNGGSGAASGQTFNGSAATSISYNTLGAVPTTRSVNTSYPIQGGGALSGDLTLTFSGLATTSTWIAGQLAYVVNGNTLTGISTSSETCSAPVSCGAHTVLTGGGAISISQASTGANGYLSLTDFGTFNNKISSTSLSATFPLAYSSGVGAFTFGGLSTSSAAVVGAIPYFSGVNTFANVATGTVSAGSGILVTGSQYIIGSGLTITNTNAAPFPLNATSSLLTFSTGLSSASTTLTGPFVFGNATGTAATTTNLAITNVTSSLLKTNSTGGIVAAVAGTDYANFGYLFPSNATTTGLLLTASTTIGAGGATTGLTINGGATTTGSHLISGTLTINTLSGLIGGNNGVTYGISTSSLNANITGSAGSVANAVTFNNGGSGAASGQTFNGSAATTISYNTLGAVPTTRNINTTYPLQGGGALSGDLTLTSAFGTTSNTGLTANRFVYTDNAGIFQTAASSSLNLPNTALQNSSVTVNTSAPLGGGGVVSLGGAALTLTCATCSTFAYPFAGTGNSTTSPIMFLASTTIGNGTATGGLTINGGATTTGNAVVSGSLTIGTLAGLIGSNNGLTYAISTSTNFVTSLVAGSGISLSGATGAVTITNTMAHPFPSNATSSLLTFSTGLTSASTTLTGPFVFGNATGTNATTTALSTTNLAVGSDLLNDITGTGLSISGNALTVSGLTTTQFSSANISQWTNNSNYITLASLSATTPLIYNNTTGAFTFVGLATTSQPASSNLLVSNGTAGVYGVGTSTLTASGPLTGSFTQLGSGGALGCTTAASGVAGCLSNTSFDTFNNKQNALSATWPQILSGSTLTFGGLSTSSAAVVGAIPYFSGVNTFANVATGTVSAGAGITVTGNQYIIGSGLTITNTNAAPFPLNATSTLLTFSTGLSSASTTLTGPFVFGNATGTNATTTNFYTSGTATIGSLSGLVGSNNGVLYQTATSSNFVTSLVASAGISLSGSTGAVTVTNTVGYPFAGANNSTSSPLMLLASTTIGGGGVTTGLTVSGTATTSNLIDTSITSALALFDVNHKQTAYAGASACAASNFVTTISATGGTTCGTASISGVNLGSNLNSVTFNNGGSGTASGGTFNGSSAVTVSYNTLGAVPTTRNVNTTYPLQGGGALSGDLTLTSAFGTTSNTGLTANRFVYTDNAGIFQTAASSSLNLPNTALQNSSVTVNTSAPLGGGGAVSLGGAALTLTCATCSTFAYPFTNNATNTLVTFSSGLSSASTTLTGPFVFGNATGTNATTTALSTTNLAVGSDLLNDITGTGLSISGNALTVSGLTTTQFSSANISQWTNNSNYITLASLSATTPLIYNNTTGAFTFVGLATTSQPASSNLLVSNGTSGVYGVATSSETCSSPLSCASHTVLSGGGAITLSQSNGTTNGYLSSADWLTFNSKVATGTNFVSGNLPYWGSNGTLFNVATSTLTASGPLTGSFTQLGSGGALGCTTAASGVAGCLSNTSFDTFNNKQNALSATWPVILSGSALSFGGLSTSSAAVVGAIPYFSGVNTFANVATGTVSAGNGILVTGSQYIIGSGLTITNTNAAPFPINATSSLLTFSVGLSSASTTLTGPFVFGNATGTAATTTNLAVTGAASTSALVVSGLNSASCDVKASLTGVLSCGVDATGAGSAFPFTPSSYGGVTVNATTSPIWLTATATFSLIASSTFASNASSTLLSNTGGAWFGTTLGASNVGLGTTTPLAKLSIHAQNGDTNTLLFAIGSSTATATSTLFVVSNTGNVGVGTTSPSKLLSVGGDALFGTGSASTLSINAGIVNYSIVGTSTILNGLNNVLSFATSTTATAVLSISTRNGAPMLGIGTTSPGTILSVGGVANFSQATSTFVSTGGINLTGGGCYAINGNCIGYTVKLAAVFSTSTPGTDVVLNLTGTTPSAVSYVGGTPGTLKLPINTSYFVAEVRGGGGGGGGVSSAAAVKGAGGGGQGGFARKIVAAPTGTYKYTVGAGGAGGTTSGTVGSFGGQSCVSAGSVACTAAIALAYGGAGGAGATGAAPTAGGSGATTTNEIGDYVEPGLPGGNGSAVAAAAFGGFGGGQGGASSTVTTTNGANGAFGGGGSGGAVVASAATTETGGNGGTGVFIVSVYATTSANAAGNDYAEMFPVSNSSISAGQIVSVDKTTPVSMKLAEQGDTMLAGVVATSPGQILGDSTAVGQRPIALAGRVPVKVNLEGGPITIGDRIAISSVAGVGKRGTMLDDTVGIALESFDGSSAEGEVTVFLDLQQGISVTLLSDSLLDSWGFATTVQSAATTTTDATSTPQTPVSRFFTGIFSKLTEWFASATNGIGDMFANVFHAKEKICIDDQCLTKDDVKALLLLAHPVSAATSTPPIDPGPAPSEPPSSDSLPPTTDATSTPENIPEVMIPQDTPPSPDALSETPPPPQAP